MKQKAFRISPPIRRNFTTRLFAGLTGGHPNSRFMVFSMKVVVPIFLSMIFLYLPVVELTGQNTDTAFDTIRLERSDNQTGFNYVVSNFTTKEIGYKKSSFEKVKGGHFPLGTEAARGIFTLLTGWGSNATHEFEWLLAGMITTDDQKLNWKVDIFCPGSILKSTERVRNSDGSVSNETSKEMRVNWERSLGLIIRQSDTIGSFMVVKEPRNVRDLDKWTSKIFTLPKENQKKMTMEEFQMMTYSKREFALCGNLNGKEIMIIYDAEKNQLYLFKETELSGVLQADQRNSLVRKKNRIKPSLLINNNISQENKSDVLLLSMLGQWFKDSCIAP